MAVHIPVISNIIPYLWVNGERTETFEAAQQTSIVTLPLSLVGVVQQFLGTTFEKCIIGIITAVGFYADTRIALYANRYVVPKQIAHGGICTVLPRHLHHICTERTGKIGNDDKVRHTTTHRELISLPNGAFGINMPCMRKLGMWDSSDGIDTAFSDIEELSHACKYADCTHTAEPGCADLQALADGTLDAARLASYRELKTENDHAADNIRYPETERAKFKEFAKINKSGKKRTDTDIRSVII